MVSKRFLITVAAGLLLGAIVVYLPAKPARTFAQYPGFDLYLAANPPASTPPDATAQALLKKYRPRFFLPKGHDGLIDFYRDYVANGRLEKNGRVIATGLTRRQLNEHKHVADAVFVHTGMPGRPARPAVYGRIDRAEVSIRGFRERITFLTYHAVFARSGLPAGLAWWQAWPLSLIADLKDWHQLDHYTAVTVLLDGVERPRAVMFQQHNYQRSYLIGEAIVLPTDNRIRVDVAIRSNELYPHAPGRSLRRAVGFLNPKNLGYMFNLAAKPMFAAPDITEPEREADYHLEFLAPADAFYTFKGFLGERRRLPGRSGPPGADYNTLPQYKPLPVQFVTSYWRDKSAADLARFKAGLSAGVSGFYLTQAAIFWGNLACLRRVRLGCGLSK